MFSVLVFSVVLGLVAFLEALIAEAKPGKTTPLPDVFDGFLFTQKMFTELSGKLINRKNKIVEDYDFEIDEDRLIALNEDETVHEPLVGVIDSTNRNKHYRALWKEYSVDKLLKILVFMVHCIAQLILSFKKRRLLHRLVGQRQLRACS